MTFPQNAPDSEKTGLISKNRLVRLPLRALLVLILIVILKESTALYYIFDVSDYPTHIQVAESMAAGGQLVFPHWLYEGLTIVLQRLIPGLMFRSAGFLVALLAAVVLANVLAMSLYRQMQGRYPWTAVMLALGLVMSAPILLLTQQSGHYFGYQHLYTYHNPSTTLMRPLAVMAFLYTAYAYAPPVASWGQILIAAIVSFLLGNAKLNYSIVLVPVAGLMSAYKLLRQRFVDLKILSVILGILVALVAFQYLTFFDRNNAGSLSFKPFEILMKYRDLTVGEIMVKQALSIVFPLVVLKSYWPVARRDSMLILAWGCFLVGWFYTLCLVENRQAADNNFYWSGEISLFVLFFASVHFWLRAMGRRFDLSTRRAKIVMVVWALHIISGIFWYGLQLAGRIFY